MAAIEVGTKFGRLTVIGPGETIRSGQNLKRHKASSICTCECGNTIQVLNGSLKSNLTKSCGCLSKEFAASLGKKTDHKRIDGDKQALKNYLAAYKSGARNRKLQWCLTDSDFSAFVSKNCHYCGEKPRPYLISRDKYLQNCLALNIDPDIEFAEQKVIMVNGVDRLDNDVGYLLENCVSCCPMCNKMKGSLPLDAWIKWLKRISCHLTQDPSRFDTYLT